MKFQDCIEELAVPYQPTLDVELTGMTCDSRACQPGWAFVALAGAMSDGANFIPQALAQGASAILCDRRPEMLTVPMPLDCVPFATLLSPRKGMALASRRLYGAPDTQLSLLGVTGTNGKTTTTLLIRQLLQGMGLGCGVIGTVFLAAGQLEEEASRTSPESPVFYRYLHESVRAGDVALAAEVSSHALSLDRAYGAKFKVGLFTNLTHDHLDYHGDLESYYQAKASLFNQCDEGLTNLDDPYGRRLQEERPHLLGYAIEVDAPYQALDVRLSPTGTTFRLRTPHGVYDVTSPLLGGFNAYNLLAALSMCHLAGFDIHGLLRAVPALKGAPGRLERVDKGQPFGIMIDYAHTPDALEKLLAAGKALLPTGGRLHVLFGCGGGKDKRKRPTMAAAVASGADVIWHTSDNTRLEDPDVILDEAALGISSEIRENPDRYVRMADRALAVYEAVQACRPGDLLLLAGKGHEPYQDVQGVKHPYSDRAAVEAALRGEKVPRPWANAR